MQQVDSANRVVRITSLWLAILWCSSRAASLVHAADTTAVPTIASMRAAYREQLGSIHTLSATYRIVDSLPPRKDRDETPKETWTQRYLYHRDGGKFYLGQRTAPMGLVASAQIWDGQKFYAVMRQDVATPEEGATVTESDGLPPIVLSIFRPEHLVGAELWQTNVTLHEALASPTARLVGRVKGDSGDPCWRIAIGSIPSEDKKSMKNLVVDLDPCHDFLPARIELTASTRDGASFTPTGWRAEWQIEQFAQVRDEATGKMRWFPQKARLIPQKGANSPTIVIERIAINAKIPDSTFDPMKAPVAPLVEEKPPAK